MCHARTCFPTLIFAMLLSSLLPAQAKAGEKITLLRVPNEGIQPQLAVDAKAAIHLIYFKGQPQAGDVYYVKSSDAGASWSKAIRVNSEPGSVVAMGNIRGSQIALGKAGRVHVSWMGSSKTTGGDHKKAAMLYARMNDAHDAFEAQRNIITSAYGLDGGGSITADETGNIYIAWHAGLEGGEQARRVWLTRSTDEGKTFAKESAIDDGTGACGCCGMRIATNGKSLFVLYRNASTKSDRDMKMLVSHDAGRSFETSMSDAWMVQMCPMSLPSIATYGSATTAAWETAGGKAAFARIDEKTGKSLGSTDAPQLKKAPAGPQKFPVTASDKDGNTLFVWTQGMGWNRGGAVAWQLYDAKGFPLANKNGVEFGVAAWSVVAVAATDKGFVIFY